jgi:oligopeptide transport system ATP-binding protein
MISERKPILKVRDLSVDFAVRGSGGFFRQPDVFRAVKKVSFDLYEGETLGIVGESGSGKSTLSRAIIRLVQASEGETVWLGNDIQKMEPAELLAVRRDIQMVFQDPLASLNPRMTAGAIIAEPLLTHFPNLNKAERQTRVAEMMEKVGLSPSMINRYPHEFSGGQCQRIGIARALITNPKLLICDEAVSALDVSIRAQVINLLMDLQKELGISMLFISHDIAVVRHIAQRTLVMYLGEVVELGDTEQVVENPQHDYTKKLIAAVPVPDPKLEMERREERRRLRREAAAA